MLSHSEILSLFDSRFQQSLPPPPPKGDLFSSKYFAWVILNIG